MTTGIPTESKPVTFATRVIPMIGANRSTCLSVDSTFCDRCVPSRKTLGVRRPDLNSLRERQYWTTPGIRYSILSVRLVL